jgi:Fe-S cluster assembly scaffold protein SufB
MNLTNQNFRADLKDYLGSNQGFTLKSSLVLEGFLDVQTTTTNSLEFDLEEEANLDLIIDLSRCQFKDFTFQINHTGKGSKSDIKIIISPETNLVLETLTLIVNLNQPETYSKLLCKTVHNDFTGRLAVTGQINSNPQIDSQIEASFYHYALALSEKLNLVTRPQLIIANQNIQVSHGFSTQLISKNQTEYLQSKGFERDKLKDIVREVFIR